MNQQQRQPDSALAVRGLTVVSDGWPLLTDVTVTVPRGECLVLADENDTFRTAFLEAVAGVRAPDAGEVTRARMRVVWHADGLAEERPVEQSIAAQLSDVDPHVLLGEIGLGHRATHEPWAMSAGERRRIALAIAFADTDAELLLLDDPERGLDAHAIAWVCSRLAERLATGTAAVVATYDARIAALGHATLSFEPS